MNKKQVLSNRRLDSLIMHGDWSIDFDFAMGALSQYMFELDLLASGAELNSLGIKKRLEGEKSELISPTGNRTSFGNIGEADFGSIARLKLSGTMRTEGGMSSRGIKAMADEMLMLADSKKVDGFFIDANSGGGESSSGYILSNAIQDVISLGKPVVTHAYTLGSAAVRATAFSTEIIAANEAAKIGSIGSFISIDKSLIEWYEENIEDIYSKDSPDKNLEFREMLKGNLKPFQDLVNKSDARFMAVMRKARNLQGSEKVIEKTLSGGMFEAREAKRRGLIDSIGSQNYAINRLRSHIKFNKNKK